MHPNVIIVPTPRSTTNYGECSIRVYRSLIEFQVDNIQLVRSTGVKVSVMVLQGRKSSPQKSRPLESGHSRHAAWIAI